MKSFLRKWYSFIFLCLLIAGTFFLLGYGFEYYWPRVKSWLMVEVELQSQKHSPLRVWPEDVNIETFPLRVVFSKVRILPQASAPPGWEQIFIQKMEVQLNWLSLFRGQLRLAQVHIIKPEVKLNWPVFMKWVKENKKSTHSNAPFRLNQLQRWPLDQVSLSQLHLNTGEWELIDADVVANNMADALMIELNFPVIKLRYADMKPLDLGLDTRFLIDDQNLQVSALKIKKMTSYLVASGYFQGDLLNGKWRDGNLKGRTHFNLNEWEQVMKKYFPEWKVPALRGVLNSDMEFKWSGGPVPDIQFHTQMNGVKWGSFEVGQVKGKGEITSERMKLSSWEITNSAGTVALSEGVVNRDEEGTFVAHVNIPQMELRQLLINLTVPETPLHLDFKSEMPCSGSIHPFHVVCKGQVMAQNLWVHSGAPLRRTIVAVNDIKVDGELEADLKRVKYKGKLSVGKNSTGTSQGVIDYQSGFKIEYDGQHIDFQDIQNLAQLKFSGTGKLRGTTEGSSRVGRMNMDVEMEDFWFEDYALGKVSSEIQYKEGNLSFSHLKGLLRNSRYNGQVGVNLRENTLKVNGHLPFLELADLKMALSKKISFPLEVSGSGSAEVNVSGPLILNQLNADVRSGFFRGSLGNESFDEWVFNAQSVNGNAEIKQSFLTKASSRMNMEGKLSSQGNLDLVLVGRNLRLEQSENVERLNLNVMGLLDFTSSIQGNIKEPQMNIYGRLSQFSVAEQPYDDSNFRLKINSKVLEGKGQLLGDQIQTEMVIPLQDDSPFRLLVNTKGVSFSQLGSIFSTIRKRNDFDSRLTMKLDLHSPQGGVFKSSGFFQLQELSLTKGNAIMALQRPVTLNFNEGVVNSESFSLRGQNTDLTFLVKDTSQNHFDISMNGKMDLSLASLFTPFLEDLKGQLTLATQLKGQWSDPELLGSAFIEKGYVKLKDFPQSFEQVRSDLLFNHQQIVVNAMQGQLGGGNFNANGSLQIKGFTEAPVEIKGHFQDISLTVPEGVKTKGSGEFYIRGKWFPYTLGGDYHIYYGDVTKEVGKGNQKSENNKASSFLPDFLLAEKFQPLSLDWNLIFTRPMMIKNSLVQSSANGSLNVKGFITEPKLKGQINLEKEGKVFFHDTPFDVNVGRVDFSGEDSQNPNIFLTASTRVKDQYDISLLVQGRAQDPQINLSSQPSLSETEIITLLALGIAPDSETKSSSKANELATQTSLQIGSALLQKPLGDINKLTGVAVEVSSTTGSERTTVPVITLKKQWNPRLGVSASKTIENTPTNNAKVEYKMNKKMSVIGTWENKEGNPEVKDTSKEKVGMDLEYRVEFK